MWNYQSMYCTLVIMVTRRTYAFLTFFYVHKDKDLCKNKRPLKHWTLLSPCSHIFSSCGSWWISVLIPILNNVRTSRMCTTSQDACINNVCPVQDRHTEGTRSDILMVKLWGYGSKNCWFLLRKLTGWNEFRRMVIMVMELVWVGLRFGFIYGLVKYRIRKINLKEW